MPRLMLAQHIRLERSGRPRRSSCRLQEILPRQRRATIILRTRLRWICMVACIHNSLQWILVSLLPRLHLSSLMQLSGTMVNSSRSLNSPAWRTCLTTQPAEEEEEEEESVSHLKMQKVLRIRARVHPNAPAASRTPAQTTASRPRLSLCLLPAAKTKKRSLLCLLSLRSTLRLVPPEAP